MNFLQSTDILSSVISDNYTLIPVINRFGVKLGLGEKTIKEIAEEKNLNVDFFLVILNTYLNEEYFPEKKLQNFEIDLIAKYLKQTDAYYMHAQMPNIEKHLHAFIAMSDPNNKQLELIRKLFFKFKEALQSRIEKGIMEDDSSLALLLDLKNILIKHISGNFNENLCYGVIFSVDTLLDDLIKHNRMREKILKPMVLELEEDGIADWQEIVSSEIPKTKENQLSAREIDVLKLVASGFLNKEVADKLNISLNTVLSHRKNISAKLGIKTVSGLIFYCISHGYLSADEIEL